MEKRLFLIDGNSLINRAFYALPPLTTAQGEPTNAVYGLTMMLFRLMEDYSPDQMFVAFDVPGPTFRHEQFEEYKANRKGMPDDLRPQMGLMKEVLDALGIPRLELAGYEADDIIGTASKLGEEEGYEVYIVTGDRDAFQLISPQTQVLFTKRGITETELVNEETLKKNYSLTPKQVIDLKGLMGDSSDNIPGVPGVGEKTALKLLAEYDNMEAVYANLNQIRGKLKERLETYKEQAFLSKELATIQCTVPLAIEFGKKDERHDEELRQLFQRLEFRTLLERLPQSEKEIKTQQRGWDSSYEVLNREKLDQFVASYSTKEPTYLVSDLEQELVAFLLDDVVWIGSIGFIEEIRSTLLPVLREQEDIYCSSAKILQQILQTTGEPLSVTLDLELAGYCLDPAARQGINALAAKFGLPTISYSQGTPQFLASHVRLLKALSPLVIQELKKQDLWKLYHDVEIPLAYVLAKMEHTGILVDPVKLNAISADLEETLNHLTVKIYELSDTEFNINSPKQLGEVLFDKMGLPVIKRTKTGPSTSAEVLEQLTDYPIVNYVLEYRQVAKLKSTYADALPELISPKTKRIHTTFNQTVTATGRLSSTNPNLQNIPVRTAEGRRIREAFIAPEGHYLLSADYSQIELRVLAHISGDEALLRAFQTGQDIHTQTASEVFGIPVDEVSPEQRNDAKAINFGIVYGISSFGLAKGINRTRAQAQTYIDTYFARYPKVKEYMDRAVEEGERLGYVTTLFQRRRYLPEIKSRNYAARSFAARTAINSPIQGSAADIIKLAMINVARALQDAGSKAKLLLQVHDELVLEVPKEELPSVADLVRKEMEDVVKLDVPLIVDLMYGENWRDVKPFSTEVN